MSTFTSEELEEMVNAISQKLPTKEEAAKIPLRPPGSFGSIAKVAFSPLEGEPLKAKTSLTDEEKRLYDPTPVDLEITYGTKKITLKELAGIEIGTLLPLQDLCDDLVTIKINGISKARGEIVSIDGQLGIRIVAFLD